MRVTFSYTMVTIDDAPAWLDAIGRYKLKVPKKPGELKQEKIRRAAMGRKGKIPKYRTEDRTVMERDPQDPSRLCFLPGFWPRVKEHLEARGAQYELIDKRDPTKKPPLDPKAFEGLTFRTNQDVAIALLATADYGIIDCSVGFGKTWLIAVLCKALPTLRIVVATSSVSVVKTNYERIKEMIPGEVGILTGSEDTSYKKRVVVTTLKSLEKIMTGNVDLLLVDECHDIGPTAADTISKFYFSRRFGFTASPHRNDGSWPVVESLLGPIILKMSYDEAVDAGMVTPMKYVMLPCSWCPRFLHTSADLPDFLLRRYAYWTNKARNNAIKEFMYDLRQVSDAQTLIVVNTLEHAIQLHILMPWLVIAFYGNVNMEDLRKRFPKSKYPNLNLEQYKMNQKQLDITRKAFAKGTLRWVVSTYVFRQGVSFDHLKVLVRADGTTSKVAGIQIPGRLSRLDEGKDYAYLVDFNDTFTEWAASRSATRAKLYSEQGWKEITREELLNDLRTKSGEQLDDASGAPTATA